MLGSNILRTSTALIEAVRGFLGPPGGLLGSTFVTPRSLSYRFLTVDCRLPATNLALLSSDLMTALSNKQKPHVERV